MKSFKVIFSILLILAVVGQSSQLMAQERKVNWKAFSVNLVKALKSDNPGMQQSAMQRIIRYADKLDVNDAVYDIANIFRFDKNPRVRRLAMVTLSRINTDKSINILSKYLRYEDEECIIKQACCIVALHDSLKKINKGEYFVDTNKR
jgi:hypothetical protein